MMHHPVAERCGRNEAVFGVVDIKTVVWARGVCMSLEFELQCKEFLLLDAFKCGGKRGTALAFSGFTIRQIEVFKGGKVGVEVAVGFHPQGGLRI